LEKLLEGKTIMEYEKKIQEEDKKKLINLWLPLAIDIKGLNEVKNDLLKAKAYYEEIRKELIVNKNETEYSKSLKSFPKFNEDGQEEELPEWKEIKSMLKQGYHNFDPINLVEHLTNTEDFSQFKFFFFKNPNFLPNWLEEVVDVIDNKIQGSSKLVSVNNEATES